MNRIKKWLKSAATLGDTWSCGICGAGPYSSYVALEVHMATHNR